MQGNEGQSRPGGLRGQAGSINADFAGGTKVPLRTTCGPRPQPTCTLCNISPCSPCTVSGCAPSKMKNASFCALYLLITVDSAQTILSKVVGCSEENKADMVFGDLSHI